MSVPPEQRRYADWLEWGTRIALVALCASFVAYMSGWLEPLVPLERLPVVWAHSVSRYLSETGTPTGWGWIAVAGRGDYANLVGVGILCIATVVSFLRILPALLHRRERVLAVLAAAQVLVLLAAASGLLAGAH